MKIDDKSLRAMQESDTKAVTYLMTPERREKFHRVSSAIVDLLRKETESPMESYMVLVFVTQGFEDLYNIRGNVIIGKDETKQ
jgi:hypothetical protein